MLSTDGEAAIAWPDIRRAVQLRIKVFVMGKGCSGMQLITLSCQGDSLSKTVARLGHNNVMVCTKYFLVILNKNGSEVNFCIFSMFVLIVICKL